MKKVATKATARAGKAATGAASRGTTRAAPVHRTPRRGEILERAAHLFAEHGYESVSLVEVAQAVGLSKTTLYHYFGSKEQILGTLIADTIRHLSEFIAQATPASAAPEEQLTAIICAQAEFYERNRVQFKVLLTQIGSLTDPAARDAAVAWRVRYENNIRRIVEDGLRQGAFAAVRPNAVVRAVLGSIYWLVRWYQPEGRRSARDIAQEYAEVLLYGVAARRPLRRARRAA